MTEDKGILIKNIFYMLSYAFQELRRNNHQEIDGEEFEEIHDLSAEIPAYGVSVHLKQGLHRTYVHSKDELTALRGKLDINDTVRNYARGSHRLACGFDEYSEDNTFNRILKATMQLLVKHKNVKDRRKKSLLKLLPFFGNVKEIDLHDIRWSTFRFDRNSKTYRILGCVLNHDREHSGKTDGMLLYAKTQEDFQPDGHMRWHDGNMIYYRNPDLDQDFDGIKKQLENLVKPSLEQ